MGEPITHQRTSSAKHPELGDFVRRIMHNAVLLQVRENAIANTTSVEEELQDLVKKALPPNSYNFTILPVGPGGRYGELDRYLIVWGSLFEPGYPSLPSDMSDSAVKRIVQATGRNGFRFSLHQTSKRERDRMIVYLQKVEADKLASRPEHSRSETMMGVVQDVFGRPQAQTELDMPPLPAHMEQKGEESDPDNSVSEADGREGDMGTSGKGNDGTKLEDGEIGDTPDDDRWQGLRDTAEQRNGSPLVVGGMDNIGSKNGIEMMQTFMALLAINGKKRGPTVTVTLVRPPPGHPTTSVLRPVPASMPGPKVEDPEDQKTMSPLEYCTEIGNAAVVHAIYTEARSNGMARTVEEERVRRERACKMALKEVQEVAREVEWHRNGRGYKEGPWPSVIGGVEIVPGEAQRERIMENRAILKNRWSESCMTVWDNNEAADHIWAVIHALWVCNAAGKDGIQF
ncbi:hypothetical protein FRC04_007916 [Tulasnella sp. 424]|nr:hypothetical protein FRC04_007916 [Tulasnella sp. 424]KAG8975099.1 hypothetical protein FRC05_006522 [Tulasnella sp. 425]